MSRADRITDNHTLLDNLHHLMWDASDAVREFIGRIYYRVMFAFED